MPINNWSSITQFVLIFALPIRHINNVYIKVYLGWNSTSFSYKQIIFSPYYQARICKFKIGLPPQSHTTPPTAGKNSVIDVRCASYNFLKIFQHSSLGGHDQSIGVAKEMKLFCHHTANPTEMMSLMNEVGKCFCQEHSNNYKFVICWAFRIFLALSSKGRKHTLKYMT